MTASNARPGQARSRSRRAQTRGSGRNPASAPPVPSDAPRRPPPAGTWPPSNRSCPARGRVLGPPAQPRRPAPPAARCRPVRPMLRALHRPSPAGRAASRPARPVARPVPRAGRRGRRPPAGSRRCAGGRAAASADPVPEHRVAHHAPADPRRVDAVTNRRDRAGPFVAEPHRKPRLTLVQIGHLAGEELDVRTAHPHPFDVDDRLAGSRHRNGHLLDRALPRRSQHEGPHGGCIHR